MKNYNLTKLFFSLCLLVAFASCTSNEDDMEASAKIKVTDFTKEALTKLNGVTEKSWKLTEVILPEEYRDHPNCNEQCLCSR